MQQFFDAVQSTTGRALPAATVTVYDSTNALATLYSDNGVTTKANPTTTNSDGEYWFYAVNGTYHLTITAAGFAGDTRQGIVLFDPADPIAAEDISYTPAGTGAVVTTVQTKLRESVSVKDFGAVGDGVTDDTAAIQAAIVYVKSLGGGHIYIPVGTYKCSSTLNISPLVAAFNLIFEGAGQSSILDFSTCTTGPGLAIYGWAERLELSRFVVKNAFASGISINHGETISSTKYLSRINVHDIVIDKSGSHGLEMTNTYMSKFYDIESINNTGDGFHLNGNHASLSFSRCWAGGDAAYPNGGNKGIGWFVNGVIYSTFETCNADWNDKAGWSIYNTCTTNILNCGSESNKEEGFFVGTGSTYRTSVAVPDIYGLTFNGCFGFNNSKTGLSSFANLIGILTANTYPANIDIENCYSLNTDGTSLALVLNGTSGDIITREAMNFYTGQLSSVSGSIFRNNTFVQGRAIIVRLNANQSISNNIITKAQISNEDINTMGATIVANEIVIPTTTTKVRIVANASWDTNVTGSRTVSIYKNGSAISGGGASQISSLGYALQNVSSAMLQVATGDTISLQVTQTSGGSLFLLNDVNTFLSVEAIG